jgi:hypothetical protein
MIASKFAHTTSIDDIRRREFHKSLDNSNDWIRRGEREPALAEDAEGSRAVQVNLLKINRIQK